MKRLKLHWSARPLSWLLSVAMLMPLIVLLLSAAPRAEAQASAARSGQPAWAVLDFTNRSGYGGNEIGRQASDSFVVELGKSNKYDVSPRQDTLAGLDNLGLTVPLDKTGMQKLGRDRNVDAVVSGEVLTVAFDNKPRRATASVIVRVVDTSSGELINGAVAQGTSTPRPVDGGDDDSLVNQAIDNATFTAVRQITSFNLPKATVLNNIDTSNVLINKGSRDGIYEGLNLLITRNNTEVGRARVSSVEPDQSTATVTNSGLGIQPQDRATAIYQLPSYSVRSDRLIADNAGASSSSAPSGKRNSFSGIGGILIAIVVGALLLSLVKGGSSSGSIAGAEIGSPRAILMRTTDPVGGFVGSGGQGPALPTELGFPGAVTPVLNYVPVSVRITATPGNIDRSLFSEYHVYRSDFTGNDLVFHPDNNFPRPVAVLAEVTKGDLEIFDDGSDHAAEYQIPDPAQPGKIFTVNKPPVIEIGTGIHTNLIGQRFNYRVEGLWEGQSPSVAGTGTTTAATTAGTTAATTGGGNNTTIFQLTAKKPTNSVTYLQPALFTDGSITGVSSTKVNVTVPATLGATDYILEFASDFQFKNRLTTLRPANPNAINGASAPQLNPRNGAIFSFFGPNGYNLNAKFANTGAVYARMGVRDGNNGSDNGTNPYIFTDPIQVPDALVNG